MRLIRTAMIALFHRRAVSHFMSSLVYVSGKGPDVEVGDGLPLLGRGVAHDGALSEVQLSEHRMNLRVTEFCFGGESRKLHTLRENGKNICGDVVSKAIAYAVGVLEVNASMGLIVAAPTAGSSGVIPGVFCSLQENFGFTDEEICKVLFNAAAVGYLITRNATTAGAEGGCQAEVGAASAMAASAAVELLGGTPAQCLDAASFAIVNILGLVCDPIGGLVENPCQNRNAMGASNALISAELSMAGIRSITPIDETIGVMYAVGRSIPSELRETSLGGMAVAKSACEACAACAKKKR